MTQPDDTGEPAPARPAGCTADISRAIWRCDRCALAWDPKRSNPACSPMTRPRLRELVERLLWRAEASREAVERIAADDPRVADTVPAEILEVELRALLRFLERVLSNDQILQILKRTPAK